MLHERLLSTVLLIAGITAAVVLSYHPYLSLITLAVCLTVVVVGHFEFYRLNSNRGVLTPTLPGLIASLLMVCGMFAFSYALKFHGRMPVPDFETLIFTFCFLLLFVSQFVLFNGQQSVLVNLSISTAGLVYVAWLFTFIIRILYYPGCDGRYYLFFLLMVSKATDIFAYAVGTAWGRVKLFPRISPKKTVEGALGGMAGALIMAWIGGNFVLGEKLELHETLILGTLIGVATQVGDLCESLIKRDSNTKDSGSLLPGIGGILDLLDGLLFSAPILYYFMVLTLV